MMTSLKLGPTLMCMFLCYKLKCNACFLTSLQTFYLLEVRCKRPILPQKDVMIIPNQTDHEYNSTIMFKCKKGFSLKGSQIATCHQNASFWFIDGTPKCEGKAFLIHIFIVF